MGDDNVDACLEPAVDKCGMRDAGPEPKLWKLERSPLREGDVVQVHESGRNTSNEEVATEQLGNRALSSADRPGDRDQLAHSTNGTGMASPAVRSGPGRDA